MKQAVILAGGRGTRLARVSKGLPKPLVPVGGIPIIETQIALLSRYEVEEVFITTGYQSDVLKSHLGDGSRWDLNLQYVHETQPLGTAGGVAALVEQLTDDFLVLYGDVMVNMDLLRLFDFHRNSNAIATVVVHPNDHPLDSDLVACDSHGRIAGFYPYPREQLQIDLPNLVSAALYVLSPRSLTYIDRETQQDFVRDVFPKLLDDRQALFAYRTTEYLKDMGTPDRLIKVEADLRSGRIAALHADRSRPALFLDRDGVINEEIGGVHAPEHLQLLPEVGVAIARLNQSQWLAACFTNQPAIAKGFMTEQDLGDVHLRLDAELGRAGAWLDGIKYCPHHPESGFDGERTELKIDCDCRKPETGLLQQLRKELPVNSDLSVVVGDSWRDMVAAHRFGLQAIGVRTGHALRERPPQRLEQQARPDVMVDNLGAAVALLLDVDATVDRLVERLESEYESDSTPITLLLGGLSRAGKSFTAFQIHRQLMVHGLNCQVVRLDDWLVPASARTHGATLKHRYPLRQIEQAIEQLLSGTGTDAPGYDERTRETLAHPIEYPATRNLAVLIVEGVPAHFLNLSGRCIKAFVEVNEEIRRDRLTNFYRYKGMEMPQIDDLLSSRVEEVKTVATAGKAADYFLRHNQPC